MNNHLTISSHIYELWRYLSHRRKVQFNFVLVLMIASSIVEIASIGLVIPFLAILIEPEVAFNHEYIQPLVNRFNIVSPDHIVLPLTAIFILSVFVSAAVRILLLYLSTRLSFSTGSDLSVDIFRRTLYQNYSIHIKRNSSKIISAVIAKSDAVIGGIFTPILNLISTSFFIFGVLGFLLYIDIYTTLIVIIVFGTFYWAFLFYSQLKLKSNSYKITHQNVLMVKSLQEGLKGIRDVIIDGSQEHHTEIYQRHDKAFRLAHRSNIFISGSPRFVIEFIGVTIIVTISYFLSQNENNLTTAIPVLGAIALGAQKLLPAMQLAYRSLSSVRGSQSSLIDILELLRQPIPKKNKESFKLNFKNNISLINGNFKYNKDDSWVMKDFNLIIEKGKLTGFIGETGCGKSTLLDIIMGLLTLNDGKLLVDSQHITKENIRAWQANIAHVPQNIYLSDSTIIKNIAFGIPEDEINIELVEKSAKVACISEHIESLPNKYHSTVGGSGVSLSGGQLQRIGIARALYKEADLLILDEATSALDKETQERVMSSIINSNNELTLLIIAHRLSTLKQCDTIIHLNKSGIVKINHKNDKQ